MSNSGVIKIVNERVYALLLYGSMDQYLYGVYYDEAHQENHSKIDHTNLVQISRFSLYSLVVTGVSSN
jgi:hypothetical protein